MGNWVQSLAPWSDYATLTFAKEYSVDGVAKRYERFMRTRLPGVSHFYAVERNPNMGGDNPGAHVHALWADLGVKRKQVWQEWFTAYGINRILPIVEKPRTVIFTETDGVRHEPYKGEITDGGITVADYCAKYVCKDGAWWNVGLQPWRLKSEPTALVLHV